MIKVHFTDGTDIEVPKGNYAKVSVNKVNLSQEALTGNDTLEVRDGENQYSGKVVAEFNMDLVKGYTVEPGPEVEAEEASKED